MHVGIIGCGPTGLFLGAALARRGHRVTAVDRDPGPDPGGGWRRRGVMQFHHAHGFRQQVGDALQAEGLRLLIGAVGFITEAEMAVSNIPSSSLLPIPAQTSPGVTPVALCF